MPSEDFPPLAPFPELSSSASADADSAPPGGPSLLSAAQRRELAFAADLLSGRAAPPADLPPVSAADDFLLGAPSDGNTLKEDFSFASELVAEEPVPHAGDFLTLPGESNGPAVIPAGSFSLESLAASLAVPAAEAAMPAPSTAALDNREPPSMPAFPALTPSMEEKPALVTSLTIEPTPAVNENQDGFFVTLAPVLPPESLTIFPPARPLEPEEDFHAPLLFPVPSAEAEVEVEAEVPPSTVVAESDPHDRALGAVLCGALLIVAGLLLVCLLPSLALMADTADRAGTARAGHLRGLMFVCAAAGAGCLVLGIGAATLRRWAPPLIHAAGWTVLLTVLGEMALATASMFYLSSNSTPGDAVPGDGTAIFATAGVAGVALPLLLIGLFQRPGIARLCALVDPRPRWTDSRSVPALMIFVAGFGLAAGAAAMGMADAAFPAFGNLITGPAATGTWAGVALAATVAGSLAAAEKKAGWWLLTLLALALTTAVFLTCQEHGWEEIFRVAAASPPSPTGAAFAAATLLPLVLIALITRRNLRSMHM